ncbi:MAG: tetratricopeptide repeat protein [Caulobacteraceae bacterium]
MAVWARILVGVIAAVAASPACAQNGDDRLAACGRTNDEASIQACTDLINAKTLPNAKLALAYYDRGNAYNVLGEQDQAIPDYDEAIRLNPDYPDAYASRAAAYDAKGLYFQSQGQKDQAQAQFRRAIDDCTRAIAVAPRYENGWFNRANVAAHMGDLDRSIADFSQAIALKPDDAEAYYNRGNGYVAKGLNDLAIIDYTRAAALKPDFVNAFTNRGLTYEKTGRRDLALADFTHALALKADDADAFIDRAEVYNNEERYDLAVADYTQVIAIDTDNPTAHYGRAWSLHRRGEDGEALKDMQKTSELGVEWSAPMLVTRAEIEEKLNRREVAIADYHAALKLASDLKEAREGLARLGAEPR